MALQRNLKALGTFGYQTATRQNPVYIQYMPRTLRYVRANLARYPRFGRLRELLARTSRMRRSLPDVGRMERSPAVRDGAARTCGSASRPTSTTTSG